MNVKKRISVKMESVWTHLVHLTASVVHHWSWITHYVAASLPTPLRVGDVSLYSCIYSSDGSDYYYYQPLITFLSVVTHELGEDDVHTDICWEDLKADTTCTKPLYGFLTTFTECCCLYGLAWGSQCALCPRKSSGKFLIHILFNFTYWYGLHTTALMF